jgi:hypothetical protein
VRHKYDAAAASGPTRECPMLEDKMLKNFDDMQKYGKDNMDASMKAWGQVSKGVQAIAAESADFSKKSFEEGSAALEKLLGAKSLEKAIEIQTAYAKSTYEGFVAQATRMGELYADLAKESYKPFENFVGQAAVTK